MSSDLQKSRSDKKLARTSGRERWGCLNGCFYAGSLLGGSKPGYGEEMKGLVIAAHALTAGALVIASVLAVRFVGLLPLWLGVLVGLLLYAITLVLAKADDGDEEVP